MDGPANACPLRFFVDPEAFERCFMPWMAAAVQPLRGRLLAIDGYTKHKSIAGRRQIAARDHQFLPLLIAG